MGTVALRPVEDADLGAIFDQQRDPEAVRMAAFVFRDPDDRAAFDAHMERIRSAADTTVLAVTLDDRLVGTVGCFVLDGNTEVTYWIAREHWGQGIATAALRLLVARVATRPIHASAASDNHGSLRVLHNAGFTTTGTATGHAPARGGEIEETLLRLD